MRLTLTNEAGQLFNLDVDASMELENLKALAHVETNIPMEAMTLYYNGAPLTDDKKSLAAYGVKMDDIILITQKRQAQPTPSASGSAARTNGSSTQNEDAHIEQIRQSILADPNMATQMARTQPEVLDAARNNPARFTEIMRGMFAERKRLEMKRLQEIAALEADPFDIEAQKKIEAMIQRQNIESNMENAMEHNPEAFGTVIMLYIDCEVNGHPVKAFVDSGAQMTIMSPECAEYCQIIRLLDTRFAGIAKGVGTAKILGRVHAAPLRLGKDADPAKNLFLQGSITVMEGKGVDMLLGLDMLRRFQMCIDLSKNCLRVGDFELPFLSEADLPDKARKPEPDSPLDKPAQNLPLPSSAPAATPSSSSKAFPETDIASIMGLGASRAQAIATLEAANGNVEVAANIFFSE